MSSYAVGITCAFVMVCWLFRYYYLNPQLWAYIAGAFLVGYLTRRYLLRIQ